MEDKYKWSVSKVLNKNPLIPIYQRDYEWKKSNVLSLFDDIATKYDNDKYINLGTIILLNNNNQYEIIDGQQRLTTLSLLLHSLDNTYNNSILSSERFISEKFNNNIIYSYEALNEVINIKYKTNYEKKKLYEYIMHKTNFYVIEVDNEKSAFQLFDSRNSKYMDLKAIDLLKAYHIGEFEGIKEEMANYLYNWSKNMNESFNINKSLSKNEYLFNNVLFTIYNWSLNKDKKDFSKEDIYLYKGYKDKDKYNYVEYYRQLKGYQINKPFKAGKNFFDMVQKYISEFDQLINDDKNNNNNIINRIICKIDEDEDADFIKSTDYNYYLKNTYLLYYNALLFLNDKYGDKVDEFHQELIEEKIFKWSINYRIMKKFAGIQSANAYVLKNNFFYECANSIKINELIKFESDTDNLTEPNKSGDCGRLRGILWNINH